MDDDPLVGDLFGRIGRKQGFETRVVRHSHEFKYLWETFVPDVVLLDLFMPVTDGFELLHYLGTQGRQAHLIVTSGKDLHFLSSARRLAQAYGLRSVDTVSKPVDIEDLARLLDRARLSASHDLVRQAPGDRTPPPRLGR